MEYSLQRFNQNANLKSITLTQIIDKLNLIGFEIDEVFNERSLLNNFSLEIRFLIKVPANREDLLSEKFLLTELSTIFLVDLFNTWKKIEKNYAFLLKKQYYKYRNFNIASIKKSVPDYLFYSIQLEEIKFLESPIWVQRKINEMGLKSKGTIIDLLTLVNCEFGHSFNFISIDKTNIDNKTIPNNLACIFDTNELSKNVIFNNSQKFYGLNFLENSNFIDTDFFNEEKDIFLNAFFYDIQTDKLNLKNELTKSSLRILKKSYLETFKNCFLRLLTLLEIIYSVSFNSNIYSNIEDSLINLQKNKILKLEKISLKNFLNIEHVNSFIFESAGLKIVCETKDKLYFNIPNYRNDIKREIDLIEEYSRFFGYKNFKLLFPELTQTKQKDKQKSIKYTKQFFLSQGFNEVVTNSLENFKVQFKPLVFLANPLTQESSTLRLDLITKLVEIFNKNIENQNNLLNFFQIGRVFYKSKNKKFIVEKDRLAGIFQIRLIKKEKKITNEWFIAKGLIENYLRSYGYENLILKKSNDELTSYHKTKSVDIFSKNVLIGKFGEIDPKEANIYNLKYSTYIFEIDFENLQDWKLDSELNLIKELSKYPSVTKDLSLIVDKQVDFYFLKKLIKENLKDLRDCKFFDIFFDEKSENKVNIGIRLQFQSDVETLKTENIENQIITLRNFLSSEIKASFN